MTLLTLFKTLIVIAIASFVILFYTVKMKKINFKWVEEEKSKLDKENSQLKLKNQDLKAKNGKLEEEKNPELKQKNQELERKVPKLEEKKAKPNEKKAEVEEEFCEPKINIMFLKTHKTASTTVMNLFIRFAIKHQLTVAVPVNPLKVVTFRRCLLYPLKPGNEYNMLTIHTRFNYEEMKDVMPKGTTFLTILRDPAAQFESEYAYFSLDTLYGMNITTFADLDMSLPEWSRLKNLRKHGKKGRNPMCHDLGLESEFFDDEEAILRKIQELDQQFDLVMITELFNESMILLKEKLCWDLSDVTGIKSNVRRAEKRVHLSSEHKKKLREKNRADHMLYDHFYHKLLSLIDAFGKEKMEEEVGKLRGLTEEIDEVCMNHDHKGKIQRKNRFKVGAEEHKVCQAIINYQKSGGWRKLNKSKFAKEIECED